MQSEDSLPIDIHTNKILDWLISRRHCNRDWQNSALIAREKINNAIQDMPEVEEITQLLAGTYINYFHCLRIVELLKETEASTKNIFGRYSSQRMKDWQEIVKLYEKDSIYLAEAAQMLIRNVNYEIPSIKRQITKCQQIQEETVKKEADYIKHAQELKDKYYAECHQLGIEGKAIKKELLSLLDELPTVFADVSSELSNCKNAVEFYQSFLDFTLDSEDKPKNCLPLVAYLIEKGNTSTYEWKHGEPPEVVEELKPNVPVEVDNGQASDDQIDFGDLVRSSGENSPDTPNGDFVHVEKIDFGTGEEAVVVEEGEISWDISVEDSGITVEGDTPSVKERAPSGGAKVARGPDALSVFHNPETRNVFLNELKELECFLMQRLVEMQGNDVVTTSILQQAPPAVQLQTIDTIQKMLTSARRSLNSMTTVKMQHLYLLHSSPKYVDRLVESLQQKLYQSDKMLQSKDAVIIRRQEALEEQKTLEPKLDLIIEKTKVLQKQIEEDISKRYKNRPVNIMGGVNVL